MRPVSLEYMIITGTRSYIIIETEGKSLKIEGELTTPPVFYADKDSIKNWESPYEDIRISEDEKMALIKKIVQEGSKEGNVKVIFD